MKLVTLFYLIDEFCKEYEPRWQQSLLDSGLKQRRTTGRLSLSEILTIAVYFHLSSYRMFKWYYQQEVFKDSAARGRTSEGWFFGFKLHIVVNDRGELLALRITPGNVSDANKAVVNGLTNGLKGKLFGDKDYLSKEVFEQLWQQGLQLVTNIRRNMKQRLLPLWDKLMLRKRFIIETVDDHLKNNEQIEHSRHRSFANFSVNLLAGLIAYQLQPKKPQIQVPKVLLLEA